jgi:hypothetical protein
MRDLLGLAAAAVTFIAATQWQAYQCEARWPGRPASYNLLTGCMIAGTPEANISASPDRIYPNWVR